MDADVANEIQVVQDSLKTAGNRLNQWNVNGLDTLLMQRAFTFGAQKVRIDNIGLQVNGTSPGATSLYWVDGFLTPINKTPALPGVNMAGNISNSAPSAEWTINAKQTLDTSSPIAATLDAATTSLAAGVTLTAEFSLTKLGQLLLHADATDVYAKLSNGALWLSGITADTPSTPSGYFFYNGTTNQFRGAKLGTLYDFVLADTSVDPLTQYALLAGRSGGQTLIGGTANTDTLKLQSNSGTKAKVLFGAAGVSYYNEVLEIIRVGATGKEVRLGEVMSVAAVAGVSLDYNSAHASQATVTALNPGTAWLTLNLDCNGLVVNPGGLTNKLTVTNLGSLVVGSAALATTATDGYLYIPTCAGTPTGVPTANTGRTAVIYDTTGKKWWIYDVGAAAWKGVVVA